MQEQDEREPAPAVDGADERSRFGWLHERTYEMELLISGAVVFALLQLPRIVGPALERLRLGLSGSLRPLGISLLGYVTFMLYALIGVFLIHLVLRAYWIGLVGLESVFGGGIRWEKVKLPARTAAIWRLRVGSLGRAIERIDDLCSLVFSFGFLIVSIMAYTVAALTLAVLAALAFSHLALGGKHLIAVFGVALAFLVALQVAPLLLDKALGKRARPDGVGNRVAGWVARVSYELSLLRWTGTTQLTLGTNLSPVKVQAAIVLVCSLFGLAILGNALVDRGYLRLDGLTYFPMTLQENGVEPGHYRDRRDAGALWPGVPSVQSELVEGPYLELVVSYLPHRHDAVIRAACPDLAPLRRVGLVIARPDVGEPEAVRAVAACFGSVLSARLDGEELTGLRWDFTREPGTKLPAVVSFVPVRGLAPGRHELEVWVPGRKASGDDPHLEHHVIPFWR